MKYEILAQKDISIAKLKRYVYYIVIEEEVNKQTLSKIFKELDKKNFNEVTVFCFKNRSDFGKAFNLAKLERLKKKGPLLIQRVDITESAVKNIVTKTSFKDKVKSILKGGKDKNGNRNS